MSFTGCKCFLVAHFLLFQGFKGVLSLPGGVQIVNLGAGFDTLQLGTGKSS